MEDSYLLFYEAVSIFSFGLLILATFLGFRKYAILPQASRWYVHYLGFIFAVEVVTKILSQLKISNFFIYPYYLAGEFFILSVMFIEVLKVSRNAIGLAAILSIFLFVAANQFLKIFHMTSGHFKIFSHLVIVCFSAYYMIKALRKFDKTKRDSFLPIYGGLLLYYAVSLILFLLLDQLTNISEQSAALLWGMNNLFSTALYSISFYVLWKFQA